MTAPGKKRKRRSELRQRQKRHIKIRKLKARLEKTKSETERKQILEKLFKISPNYPLQELQPATPA